MNSKFTKVKQLTSEALIIPQYVQQVSTRFEHFFPMQFETPIIQWEYMFWKNSEKISSMIEPSATFEVDRQKVFKPFQYPICIRIYQIQNQNANKNIKISRKRERFSRNVFLILKYPMLDLLFYLIKFLDLWPFSRSGTFPALSQSHLTTFILRGNQNKNDI